MIQKFESPLSILIAAFSQIPANKKESLLIFIPTFQFLLFDFGLITPTHFCYRLKVNLIAGMERREEHEGRSKMIIEIFCTK